VRERKRKEKEASENTAPPRPSSAKREKALAALLVSPTIAAAAKTARVGETTLFRWLQEPAFQEAYRAARLQVLSAATMQLRQATGAAVDTLRRNLTCGNAGAEIRAAATILEMAYKSAEVEDLAARVEEMGRFLKQQQEEAQTEGRPYATAQQQRGGGY